MSLPDWCPPYSDRKTSPVTGEDVYCICKKPDTGKLMVGCDGCDDWFHFSCMKIPDYYKELVFSFYCPYCQAGITGPASKGVEPSDLPKTIWKRKCRLNDCYKECRPNSKYCSEEHGELYVRRAVSKLEVDEGTPEEQNDLILRMAKHARIGNSREEFKKIGDSQFIREDVDEKLDPTLYANLITNDKRLGELRREDQELETQTIPNCAQSIERINKYLDWLNEINSKLFNQDNAHEESTDKGRKKKTARKKQKRSICGYSPNFNTIPLSVDEFMKKYDPSETVVDGVCTKLKCNKHHDWSAMLLQQHSNQLRSLKNYRERVDWLISARKEQLNIQYYEQLLRKKM